MTRCRASGACPARFMVALTATVAAWVAIPAVVSASTHGAGALAAAEARTDPVQEPPKPDAKPAESKPADAKPAEKKDEKKEEEPKKDRFFAVKGGVVHTVSGGDLRNVTVLCKNGKIHAIGAGLEIPKDAEVLDAAGHHIYPGLVAVRGTGFHAGSNPDDGTDVFSLNMTLGLAAGITTVLSGDAVAKMTFGSVEDMVVRKEPLVSLNYATRNPDQRRKLRQSFDKLLEHIRKTEAYEQEVKTNKNAEKPDDKWIKGENEKHLELLKREAVAEIAADTAHDLHEACELASRYNLRMVVRSAYEGWTIAPELARAGVSAVVTPRTRVDADELRSRSNGSSIENAAILYNHGVRLAILPPGLSVSTWGVVGEDLTHFNMEAAFAVRGGLPQDAAIRAMTLDAAKVLGVDHRVGSIDVGKDADFCIVDGDLLHYMTLTRWAVVNGRIAYDREQDTLLSHIRPGGDVNAPAPNDYWPRRLGADWTAEPGVQATPAKSPPRASAP